jgi:hypothetical protein
MLPLVIESWTWFSVVVLIVLARFISRAISFGNVKKLQVDDYLMALTSSIYTVFVVTINIVSHRNSNLLAPATDIESMSKQEIADRKFGSKMVKDIPEEVSLGLLC